MHVRRIPVSGDIDQNVFRLRLVHRWSANDATDVSAPCHRVHPNRIACTPDANARLDLPHRMATQHDRQQPPDKEIACIRQTLVRRIAASSGFLQPTVLQM